MRYVTALTIAGSDCSGGAGIQADIKTMSALGVYAASVLTSITVQNTVGVTAVDVVDAKTIAGQIHAVMKDIKPEAIKIGMVTNRQSIEAIADALSEYDIRHLIIDPVMVSTSGMQLMMNEALDVFRYKLMPMATLITPNIPEAEVLSGMTIHNCDEILAAGKLIARQTNGLVLIKGGHSDENGMKCDRLFDGEGLMLEFGNPAVQTNNTHGTGCTLSAAITGFLACGLPMKEALVGAKKYVTEALKQGADVVIGSGHGPVNHFFNPAILIKRDDK